MRRKQKLLAGDRESCQQNRPLGNLIKKFADLSKKNAGEFYTPRSVVKLMVHLLKPKSGETVYDIKTPTLIQFNDLPVAYLQAG